MRTKPYRAKPLTYEQVREWVSLLDIILHDAKICLINYMRVCEKDTATKLFWNNGMGFQLAQNFSFIAITQMAKVFCDANNETLTIRCLLESLVASENEPWYRDLLHKHSQAPFSRGWTTKDSARNHRDDYSQIMVRYSDEIEALKFGRDNNTAHTALSSVKVKKKKPALKEIQTAVMMDLINEGYAFVKVIAQGMGGIRITHGEGLVTVQGLIDDHFEAHRLDRHRQRMQTRSTTVTGKVKRTPGGKE